MKTFNYTARSVEGGIVEGIAEANTKAEAIGQLRDSGLVVETITEADGKRRELKFGSGKIKEKSLSVLCNQFSILLQAGLPMVRTLELLADQTEDKKLAELLFEAANEVAAGYGLADSLQKHGEDLPTTFIESVRAGEESGSLETVFERMKVYYEKTSATKAKVKSAMVYPIFVMIIAVIVVAIIMIFAVPVFRTSFASLGNELPPVTQFVINVSDFFLGYWWLIAALIAAIVIGVKLAKRNDKFHLMWSKLGVWLPFGGIRTPVIGRINIMNSASEYAGTMSVMMSAGLPIVRAVGVTSRSMNNYYMGHSLAKSIADLEAGRPLAACLQKEETLPRLAIEMTAVGEQTGALESTMNVISEYYDSEVEIATQRAMSLLEPMIIVVLAGIVFVLLLAVYMPLFSMYGNIGA